MQNHDNAIEKARKLAQTEKGQQLSNMLRQIGGTDLESALSSAASGNYSKLQQELSRLLENPEARKLLESLEW